MPRRPTPTRAKILAAGAAILVAVGFAIGSALRGDADFSLDLKVRGAGEFDAAAGVPAGAPVEFLILAKNSSASIPANFKISGDGGGAISDRTGDAAAILAGGSREISLGPGEVLALTGAGILRRAANPGEKFSFEIRGENRSRSAAAAAEILPPGAGSATDEIFPDPTKFDPKIGTAGTATLVRTDGGRPRRGDSPGDAISIRRAGAEVARAELGESPYRETLFAFPGHLEPGVFEIFWKEKSLGKFELLPAATGPAVEAVTPTEIPRGESRDIVIQGRGLGGAVGVQLGDRAILAENLRVLSDRVIAAKTPGDLPVGDFEILVTTPDGTARGPALRIR